MLVGLPILLRILFGVAAPGSLNMIPCKSACFGAALAIAVLSGYWLSIVVEDLHIGCSACDIWLPAGWPHIGHVL
jgi:hypothetical protein